MGWLNKCSESAAVAICSACNIRLTVSLFQTTIGDSVVLPAVDHVVSLEVVMVLIDATCQKW